MKIGSRLGLSFTVIVLLMLAGGLLTFWQVHISRENVQQSLAADQKQLAVLRVHTDVLEIDAGLGPPIINRDLTKLKTNANAAKLTLIGDIRLANEAIARSPSTRAHDARLLAILQGAQNTLPEQVQLLQTLAAVGDWDAVQLRFSKQMETVAELTSLAAKSVNTEVSERRLALLENLRTAQNRLLWILAATTLLCVLAAAGLGAKVTAGITRPLRELESAARSLASGNFSHHAPEADTDEIATLRDAFNFATTELHTLYNELSSLNRRLILAQEEERTRIARELHDDFGQRIAALGISLSTLKRQIPSESAALQHHAERIFFDLIHMGDSLRRLSHTLHPAILEYCGLPGALRALCSEFPGLRVSLSLINESELKHLPLDAALCLYRVAQEALRNVVKHAEVNAADVSLAFNGDSVTLIVQDRGMATKARSSDSGGLGLVSMRERVKQQSGVFSFENPADGGTRLVASIPRPNPASLPAETAGTTY